MRNEIRARRRKNERDVSLTCRGDERERGRKKGEDVRRRGKISLFAGVQPTDVEVVKAVPYLLPKGEREQEHGMSKAERDKYLSRVGQPGRLW